MDTHPQCFLPYFVPTPIEKGNWDQIVFVNLAMAETITRIDDGHLRVMFPGGRERDIEGIDLVKSILEHLNRWSES